MNLSEFINANRFIVLGGHKCGTSSLHSYLKQHPEIIMPINKGLDILNRSQDIEDYKASYDEREMTNEKVFGEVSSVYLQSDRACLSIKQYFPNVKLLAILRNPIDRAFSHYQVLSERGQCKIDWEDICKNHQKFNTKIRKYVFYCLIVLFEIRKSFFSSYLTLLESVKILFQIHHILSVKEVKNRVVNSRIYFYQTIF